MNRELNELVDREALSTHARTLVFLFILIYVVFVVLSFFDTKRQLITPVQLGIPLFPFHSFFSVGDVIFISYWLA